MSREDPTSRGKEREENNNNGLVGKDIAIVQDFSYRVGHAETLRGWGVFCELVSEQGTKF